MFADHQAPTDPIHIAQNARRARTELPTVGPFRAVSVLGEAGMGIVYLAEQTSPLRRQVALKLIRPGLDSKELIARFERERQALARMSHPNVAQVFDAGTCPDGRPYFAMEYVPGLPITRFCDEHRLGIRQRLELFGTVCDATEHAHQRGLIHRDIKPSNVLVSGTADKACPKIIDFGIAKSIGDGVFDDTFSTLTGQFVGTPAYMSPEQASMGEVEIDHRTDVYSLGVLLYELLVGVLPFQLGGRGRPSLAEVQRIIREQEPITPSTRLASLGAEADTIASCRGTDSHHLRKEIRREIDWLLLRTLEKQPQRRYATAGALAEDVRKYLRHEPISVGPPTLGYRIQRFARRRRRALLGSTVATTMLIVAALAIMASGRAAETRRQLQRQSAEREYIEAQLVAHRNPAEAIAKYSKFVAEHPDQVEARLQLASLLAFGNRVAEAIDVANGILQDAPALAAAHLLLAQLYSPQRPDMAEKHRREAARAVPSEPVLAAEILPRDQAAEAVELLTRVLESDGTHFDARFRRAWRYYHLREYDKMLEDGRVLVATSPESPTAWNTLGIALSRLGKLEEGLTAYDRAISLAPSYAPTYLNRVDNHLKLSNFRPALSDCDKAIKIDVDFAAAYALRGIVRLRLHDVRRAIEDAERAISLDPGHSLGYSTLGQAHETLGDTKQAIKYYDLAIERAPNDVSLWLLRAEQHQSIGDHSAAIEDYSAALQRNPALDNALHSRALSRRQLGDYEGAHSDLTRAIELQPSAARYYHDRSRLRRWQRNYKRALEDNILATGLAPGDARPIASRAITRICLEDWNQAIADLEEVVRLGPPDVYMHLIWLYELYTIQGDLGKADAALDKAAWLVREPKDAQLVLLLAGSIKPEALMTEDLLGECGANYYSGVLALLNGRTKEAHGWFQKCIVPACYPVAEYDLAICRSVPSAEGS